MRGCHVEACEGATWRHAKVPRGGMRGCHVEAQQPQNAALGGHCGSAAVVWAEGGLCIQSTGEYGIAYKAQKIRTISDFS